MKSRYLLFVGSNNDLPADFMWDFMMPTESHHLADSLHCQTRFRCAGLVIQPTVQNAAVMAGLMAPRTTFLFEKKQLNMRESLQKTQRCGQTDDTPANDCYFHAH